jgi:glycosyltransferase involved in cell wall biosynthesis
MRIGFDAKRAFHNATGLGNYSRSLMHDLAEYFPEDAYVAFNPKSSNRFKTPHAHIQEMLPTTWWGRKLPAYWRSLGIVHDIKKSTLDVYHGLSHELPIGIEKTGIKSLVSIHDLIVWRYPEHYSAFDVWMHKKKITHACKVADRVIAISEQTKEDLLHFLQVPSEKITVCYQPCHQRFERTLSESEIKVIQQQLNLPENYFLYVGSITERKNLLNIVKAMQIERDNIKIPLVVIGQGKGYKKIIQQYIQENKLQDRIIFLSDSPEAQHTEFRNGSWFPAIYQGASALVYPSLFEGFGIPILEALWSNLPVITSSLSSLPEVAGPSSLYVDPTLPSSIAQAMLRILNEEGLAVQMKKSGWEWAQQFSRENCAKKMHTLYEACIHNVG